MSGDDLRRRRKALGLSQYALAEQLGLDQSAISKWEKHGVGRMGTIMDLAMRWLESDWLEEPR